MENIPIELLQLGAVAIIFILFIREFFVYLNKKKNGNGTTERKILAEIDSMNNNHLNTICRNITDGNREITKAITDMHNDLAEILGEIKGKIR
jgi:hypothetical protein